MPTRPSLPEQGNHLVEDEHTPAYEILVERRCLGQTELKVNPGQVGTSNATKLENLGVLDYAHLRVPLPKDLTGSGIFAKGRNGKWPEAYFLMRRSSDGFISATGMFKAAFPYAQQEEEAAEKAYIKSLDEVSSEEVAGNVWIDPTKALDLAGEYGIRAWLEALLDPEAITHGTSDPNKTIQSPPVYRFKPMVNGSGSGGKKSSGSKRGHTKSTSTSTAAGETETKRKTATPRKPRKPRTTPSSIDETAAAAVTAVNGGPPDTVKVEVETVSAPERAATGDDVEVTRVHVTVPAAHPDLPVPQDVDAMIAQASEMVKEAAKIDGAAAAAKGPTKAKGKRKADDAALDGPSSPEPGAHAPAAKRTKTENVELRKERMKRRALTGIAASLAIGALIPSIMAAFGS